jgi:hypothetical protein
VAFGNCQIARAATLGLNPSRLEFVDKRGVLLKGQKRRLATHESLGRSDLSRAPHETVLRVLDECNTYFERQPYRQWFDRLEPILAVCGASYYDRSGCHLDLVQWATDPSWRKLKAAVRKRLLADDAPFLARQLENERLRLMLVNGMGALRELRRLMASQLELEEVDPITGYGYRPTRLFAGQVIKHVRVVAWSTNIQSSHGVSVELRKELTKRVAAFAKV